MDGVCTNFIESCIESNGFNVDETIKLWKEKYRGEFRAFKVLGINNLSLKRNMITILSNKTNRGWEIRLESEKLYYFTFDLIDQKKKTLPIPSGKCSMLIDKL